MFWPVIYSGAIILIALLVRESWLLFRLPSEHAERGLYWFNVFFLFACVAMLIYGSHYLDGRKEPLEVLLPPYPGAAFAPDRSMLNGGTIWVYGTPASMDSIVNFYQEHAKSNEREFLIDPSDSNLVRMRTGTTGLPIYLTVLDLGGVRELNYSFEGRVEMATTTPIDGVSGKNNQGLIEATRL